MCDKVPGGFAQFPLRQHVRYLSKDVQIRFARWCKSRFGYCHRTSFETRSCDCVSLNIIELSVVYCSKCLCPTNLVVSYQSQWSRPFRLIFNTFVTWIHTFSAFLGGFVSSRSSSRNMPERIKLWTKKNWLIYGSRQVTVWCDVWCLEVVVNLWLWTWKKQTTRGIDLRSHWMNQLLVATLKLKEQRNKEKYLGVSKNRGTPKWMVYNGKPY